MGWDGERPSRRREEVGGQGDRNGGCRSRGDRGESIAGRNLQTLRYQTLRTLFPSLLPTRFTAPIE